MGHKITSIREFIYLDIPKLYSLYSQVFEGVTDRIIDERINQLVTGEAQGSFLKQATAESRTLEAGRHVESGILHDHMYNRLEKELTKGLVDASKVAIQNIKSAFKENSVVKVAGRAEVEDYERLGIILSKFHELSLAIAYSIIRGNPDTEKIMRSIRHKLYASNKSEQKQLAAEIAKLTELKHSAAEQHSLVQDPEMLNSLKLFGDTFNANGYEVVITPNTGQDIHYRGVLDRTWLRQDPQLIRHLYGGQSEAPWTMIGTVTHFPGMYIDLTSELSTGEKKKSSEAEEKVPDNPMMLDAYRNMFRASRAFERMFLESQTDTEIIVSPLALYREFQLSLDDEGVNKI